MNMVCTGQRTITQQIGTAIELVAGGPAQAGVSQLVHLVVTAAGYSDDLMNEHNGNFYANPGYESPGDVPVPASQIQMLDQPVAVTATNAYAGELYVAMPTGAAQNLPVKVTGTNSSAYSFNVQPEAVKVQSLVIVSNSATQIDSTNWAAVKTLINDYVYVQAMLNTTNPTALSLAASLIQWSGGEMVPGNPWQRRISKTNAVETTITASLDGYQTNLNVWIIWANLAIKVNGTLDPDDKAGVLTGGNWPTPTIFNVSLTSGNGLGGGNNLGSIDCLSTTNLNYCYSIGKMEAKAVLQPSGITSLLSSTNIWNMKRTAIAIFWNNGGSPSFTTGETIPPTEQDDTSQSASKYLNPLNGDIFDTDTPGCPSTLGTDINHTAETYANFYEYVTVNLGSRDQLCSGTNTYSYTAQIDFDATTNKVQLNALSTSLITLPTASHYSYR